MPVQLNHTIVHARDRRASARVFTEIMGLPPPTPLFCHFENVDVGDRVRLDFMDVDGDIVQQHYAFLVTEAEFDEIFGRIEARGVAHWADPGQQRAGTINTNDGGRGVYFEDPDGHLLEIITRPYGSGA